MCGVCCVVRVCAVCGVWCVMCGVCCVVRVLCGACVGWCVRVWCVRVLPSALPKSCWYLYGPPGLDRLRAVLFQQAHRQFPEELQVGNRDPCSW